MRLKADNRILVKDQPKTLLTAAPAAGATSITVANNNGFANNDYILIGRIGEEKAEIIKISSSVTAGTALAVAAGLVFAHDIDTPVTRIAYNQVRFYHGTTTVAGDATALAAAQDIDPSEVYSYYEDSVYTTGYAFVRFFNSTIGSPNGFSVFSGAIDYLLKSGYNNTALRMIRRKVRKLIRQQDAQNSDYTDDDLDEEINLAQKEVAHDRLWSFYEKIKSFSSVANQYEYNLASNVFTLFETLFKTTPLDVMVLRDFNRLRWKSDVTGDPVAICMWGRKARVYPYTSTSAATTALNGSIGATDATITVDDTTALQTQGRVIIESEVISYTGKTATTLTGCTRGEEGTDAAAHSDNTVVTDRDFIYSFQEDPDNLQDEADETAIPDPSIIAYKVAAELSEAGPMQDRFYQKYNMALKALRHVDEPKIKSAFGKVRDAEKEGQPYRDQNLYPRNITETP